MRWVVSGKVYVTLGYLRRSIVLPLALIAGVDGHERQRNVEACHMNRALPKKCFGWVDITSGLSSTIQMFDVNHRGYGCVYPVG